ncbi:MAG: MoxR family ATPase [Candidatus Heimdallarchaeota archaeon]|nr:MAG: MoxR family ATPase [Candidatus Heimdallarchaeota archaeon]
MQIDETSKICNEILTEVSRHIIGKNDVLRKVILAFLADGHILFEDYPGLAKTMICRSFATALGCDFNRIQFTPDLLPQDLTGSEIYNQKTNDFEFKPGPIFSDIILTDEINRATPKTQSALLEAMGEYQVTVGGITYPLSKNKPFLVVATQNPLELEGTFALPEAQIDRFLAMIRIGYPSKEAEKVILSNRINRKKKSFDVSKITDRPTFYEMQRSIEEVHVSEEIKEYIVEIVTRTRELESVKVGSSPRGSLDLMAISRANAALNGRDYVIPQDVKELASITLAHRIILEISSWLSGTSSEVIVEKILEEVKAPRRE